MENRKILIVDDEPDLLLILSARLRGSGFNVLTASGGKEGVKKAVAEKPDVILLDIMMPEMDGSDVAQTLGDMLGSECPPIIFLTSLVSSKDADRSNASGGEEIFLPKTADLDKILSTVKHVLNNRAIGHK